MLFVGVNNFLADWHSFNSGELLSMALDYDNWLVANSYSPPYPSINNLTDVQNLVATQNLSTFCTYLAQASTYHSTIGTLLNYIQQSDFIQQLGQLATLMTNIVQVQFTQSEILTSLSHAGKATMWNHIITQAANNQGLLAHYRTNNTEEFVKQCIIVLPSYVDSYITETVSQYLQKIRSYYNTEQYNSLINALTELYYTPSQTMQLAEWHVYGSSRLGIYKTNKPLVKMIDETVTTISYQTRIKYRYNGNKQYELSNHLGNVLVTISDRRKAICNNQDSTLSYSAMVLTATDYYSFGSPMVGRSYEGDTSLRYRYGFNGKEMDSESDLQDYGMRIYNPDLGKFLSVDPLTKDYPYYTPYQFAGNMPIWAIDLDGLEPAFTNTTDDGDLGKTDHYTDKETGNTFSIAEGSAHSMTYDGDHRLTGYTNTSDNQSYMWDQSIGDFTAVKPTYDESTNLYELVDAFEAEVSAKRPTPEPSFREKYLYWAEEGYLEGHDNTTGESTPEGVVVQPNVTVFGLHGGLTFGYLKHDGFNINAFGGGQFSLSKFQGGLTIGAVSTNGHGQVKWNDFTGPGTSFSAGYAGAGYSQAWSGIGPKAKVSSKYEINALSLGISTSIHMKLDFKAGGTAEITGTTSPLFGR